MRTKEIERTERKGAIEEDNREFWHSLAFVEDGEKRFSYSLYRKFNEMIKEREEERENEERGR